MNEPIKSRRTLIEVGARQLASGPHPERAKRDAEELLLHLLRKDAHDRNRAWLFANLFSPIPDGLEPEFMALVARRAAGEPIQYIAGETEFYRMPFLVTPAVLIPRPETELLVEQAFQLVPTFLTRRSRILDVGTGSGAVAISVSHDWSEAEITATDISPATLNIARANAKRLGFAEKIRFLHGDLLAPVAGERFDIIVSNPPYVPTTDRPTLSVEVRDHEPALALFAGNDGLDIYRRLIPAAHAALVSGGYLLLEIGYDQSTAIEELLTAAGFAEIGFHADLQGIPRVVCAQRRNA